METLARRLRSHRRERRAGVGAGLGIFRHRQVRRRPRTAQGAGATARALRLRQVRPVQARHPLCDAGASLSGPDPPPAGLERGRVGRLARRPARGAGPERQAHGRSGSRIEADHRRTAARPGAAAAAGTKPLPDGVPPLPRRVSPGRIIRSRSSSTICNGSTRRRSIWWRIC